MFFIFALVIILNLKHHQFMFLNISGNIDSSELINDFWRLYENTFLLNSSLTITILQNVDSSGDEDIFADKIIHKTRGDCSCVLQKITFGGNPIETTTQGHVIIAWNLEVLKTYLSGGCVSATRTKYLFYILGPQNCKLFRDSLHQVLGKFWFDCGPLLILAGVDSCGSTKLYSYSPFSRRNNTWGATDEYDITEVVNGSKLFANQLRDFNQFPLKVSMFIRYPYVMYSLPKLLQSDPIRTILPYSKGYGGVDAFVLGTLAKYFNFNPVVVGNSEDNPFGRVLANGKAVGSLGQVISRQVEFSTNGRFLMDYNTKDIEFLSPYSTDQLCLVAPKALKVPIWRTLLNCFNSLSWFGIVSIFCVCTIIWYYLGPVRNISTTVWLIFSFLTGIPLKFRASLSQFFFLASCMIFNLIIFGAIQGSLVTSFTTVSFYPDVHTLEEFYETNLPISTDFWHLIEDDNSDLIGRLKTRVIKPIGDEMDEVAVYRNAGTIDRRHDVERLIKTQYTGKDGCPLLHIVEECWTFHLVNIVPRGSIYFEAFNSVIMKLVEAGIANKWYNDLIRSILDDQTVKLTLPNFSAPTIYDMQAAFRVLAFGLFLSVLLFIAELVYN